MITELNQSTFQTEVIESETLVLVDFWASWCAPCRMQTPILHDVESELDSTCKICKLNVDDNMEIASTFGISSIPCLMLFKNGKAISTKVGLTQKDELLGWIKSNV